MKELPLAVLSAESKAEQTVHCSVDSWADEKDTRLAASSVVRSAVWWDRSTAVLMAVLTEIPSADCWAASMAVKSESQSVEWKAAWLARMRVGLTVGWTGDCSVDPRADTWAGQ